ncbi:hypothetical protein NicSoilE8_17170 [Arthrobacter sp. NicSoilE8]|nr:hypothetical protein NicSoilE8_17170 [Arthrobacter sp. NicSoilE8]
MNSYYPLALLVARQELAEAQSALPEAPTVRHTPRSNAERWASWRGGLATTLHRLAWAIEPKTQQK